MRAKERTMKPSEELVMGTKITREILDGYLKCRTKAYLKLRDDHGTRSDYDLLQSELREYIRRQAIKRIQAAHTEREVLRDHLATISVLKRGAAFLLEARIEITPLCFLVDGLKKTPGACSLGDFHYVPMLYYEGEKIRQDQKQLIAILGIVLGSLQGRLPARGLIYHGRECNVTKAQKRC